MTTIWGIHNNVESSDLLEGGFISIGWELPDLRTVGTSREAFKAALRNRYPNAKPGAIPIWAGILYRFAYEMQVGDYVIAPNKTDSTLSFGQVSGEYEFKTDGRIHPHTRRVTWLKTGVARGLFSQPALYEVGSALTLFLVKNHAAEFAAFISADSEESFAAQHPQAIEDADSLEDAASEDPNAERIHQFTRDFIADRLLSGITHEEFEHFTADLLRCMGYQARVTSYTSDGGVDVIAHKDPLGLEPPIIKVQCKHTAGTQSRPDVQRLIGTLAPNEVGLFVTLGSYSKEARDLERERQTLRLFAGSDLTDLVLQYYDALPSRWRELLPLRPVLVVDRDPQAG